MILIRSILFLIYFITLTIFMGTIAFVIRFIAKKHALTYAQLWTRLSLNGLEKICKISTQIIGQENLPQDKSFLIASQHQSAFDTFVWMNLLDRPAYIMKRELTRIPLVGPMLLLSGMIPLDRQGGVKALKNLIQDCQKAVNDFRQIIIFPEGTRTAVGEKVKLHAGTVAIANQLNLKIVPVSIDSGYCWPRNSFYKYPGTIHIIIHPAITDTSNRKETVAAIERSWSKLES
ncbi:1-acyl-sn-glycerol-3-phosphate acyltransferase (PlsC) (PDB:1IUQ) [Commensalibacter communis]|uniref:1-acyl-sn-glycerol-3-phosphate acyltransferase (PlsC) n=1 Tax=Commensalibacter communis TaxID=2972786 RepID=A0A9W4TMG8_9PROT|nr:lysophospholipid acyltransferase family protein [Commensalibacter communis]CAI3924673.1 1-acyl-sn-glycerol-3-phosphate acyltransferase (PlsC) (PDB:1IUQ) [Commensalibacter communis]CAI3926173.1 1-acyl-sn-glycerol-3-phosphate acyltransferase (PlsC) (PDB:1IUQ) [Commensalibacter communis]CAI3936276.1 1-acyl-sn-glycerol-3-phosphate acyltransferase (PlsC) (PDB:1IUQ) [Commensalibacter communis]CAI3936794.1 1-acyl-sn-glycerol-3-phosphate acyltransferase (PlsC) (PDB:1IUQ) [Commensalibacter communis]